MSIIIYGGNAQSIETSKIAFPRPLHLKTFSLATTPVIITLQGKQNDFPPIATGFFYELESSIYFVTAKHVVSGFNYFNSLECLDPDGSTPINIKIYAVFGPDNKKAKIDFGRVERTIDLKTDAAQCIIGKDTIVFGNTVDLFVTKIITWENNNFTEEEVNSRPFFQDSRLSKLITTVGDELFLLGYPLRSFAGFKTPIWKSGTLASEPDLEISPAGSFLIDVNSTSGMSGGPILRRVIKGFGVDEHGNEKNSTGYKLVGLYSGRALTAEEGSKSSFSLGFGWTIDCVHEIISTNQYLDLTLNK